jgi:phosphatidylinositol-3-phosphatase
MSCPRRSSFFSLCVLAAASTNAPAVTPYIPRYDHVVIVIMANHSAVDILGNSSAPYINTTLIPDGAFFSNSYAVTTPDLPNYYALFSGSTQGVTDDSCPHYFAVAGSLGQQLIDAGFSFAQYSESMPTAGYTECSNGLYARSHNPVPDFASLPSTANLPYSNFADVLANATLPTISFVVPNICNDMQGESFGTTCNSFIANMVEFGDQWLSTNVPIYLGSSSSQNGLLIVTWDQGTSTLSGNDTHIPTIFYGPHVKSGYVSSTMINHYNVLRTLEDMYGLAPLGNAAIAAPITDVWDDTIFKDGFGP